MPNAPTDSMKCYRCPHRRAIPGNAHSRCRHPAIETVTGDNPLADLVSLMGRGVAIDYCDRPFEVVGHSYGIANGWFGWPFNFDPVWLVKCAGWPEPEPTGETE